MCMGTCAWWMGQWRWVCVSWPPLGEDEDEATLSKRLSPLSLVSFEVRPARTPSQHPTSGCACVVQWRWVCVSWGGRGCGTTSRNSARHPVISSPPTWGAKGHEDRGGGGGGRAAIRPTGKGQKTSAPLPREKAVPTMPRGGATCAAATSFHHSRDPRGFKEGGPSKAWVSNRSPRPRQGTPRQGRTRHRQETSASDPHSLGRGEGKGGGTRRAEWAANGRRRPFDLTRSHKGPPAGGPGFAPCPPSPLSSKKPPPAASTPSANTPRCWPRCRAATHAPSPPDRPHPLWTHSHARPTHTHPVGHASPGLHTGR